MTRWTFVEAYSYILNHISTRRGLPGRRPSAAPPPPCRWLRRRLLFPLGRLRDCLRLLPNRGRSSCYTRIIAAAVCATGALRRRLGRCHAVRTFPRLSTAVEVDNDGMQLS